MKRDVLCNENTVVKLLVRILQSPHWEHVKIRLRTHPGNTRYNRNGAGRGQREKTFYPVSSQSVKGWWEWQKHVCMCVYGLRKQHKWEGAKSTLKSVQRHLQCLPLEALQDLTHCLNGYRHCIKMSLTYPETSSYRREAWKGLVARGLQSW